VTPPEYPVLDGPSYLPTTQAEGLSQQWLRAYMVSV